MINFLKRFFELRKLRKYKENINFQQRLWLQLKPVLNRQNKIEQEKKEIINERHRIKLPTWSKLLLVFLFINFTILEIFVGWITVQSFNLAYVTGVLPDFTPLVTLIGAVIGQTLTYWTYCNKSKAENTQNGIVYELAMLEKQHELNNDNNEGAMG